MDGDSSWSGWPSRARLGLKKHVKDTPCFWRASCSGSSHFLLSVPEGIICNPNATLPNEMEGSGKALVVRLVRLEEEQLVMLSSHWLQPASIHVLYAVLYVAIPLLYMPMEGSFWLYHDWFFPALCMLFWPTSYLDYSFAKVCLWMFLVLFTCTCTCVYIAK